MEAKYISRVTMKEPLDSRSYLCGIPAVRHLIEHGYISFEGNVTFIVGENGSGKSTLLEAIAVAFGFNAEGGTRNFNFSTRESHSELYSHITITKRGYPKDGFFLRAESLYNVATDIERMDSIDPGLLYSYGGRSLHDQSHGESFLALVQNRLGGHGMYILDEPEAALSPTRLMSLLIEIDRLVKSDSQLIIATHSPILMAFPGACIYQINDEGIQRVDYHNTDNYLVTKQFLDNPERIINYLLAE